VKKLKRLQEEIVVILCELEMYFLPAFFDIMIHLLVHIMEDIVQLGPTFLHSMMPFERMNGVIKGYVRNRSRLDGSIAKGFLTEECISFCTNYLNIENPVGLPINKHLNRINGWGHHEGRREMHVDFTGRRADFDRANLVALQHMQLIDPWVEEHKSSIIGSERISPFCRFSGEEAPGLWIMHFDGAFNLPGVGAGAVLTSPSGDKLFYAVQLCFGPEHKVSNNIAEYEGLLAGLRVANALGIKRLIVKGDSQLVVKFSNKSYTPKDEHMAAYLEEHQKMEKRFQGLEPKHIPRRENVEADEITKHASHRLAQPAGIFEERLFKPSASPSTSKSPPPSALLPPPEQGALDCRPPSGDRILLALAWQEGVD
jgi:ribonuclease HI